MPHSQDTPLAELLPPLSEHEALVEANRCLFCYDAPCTHACPTHIDVPRFIKKISTGNTLGSARTILEANLLGATCARVCPVEELCEGACVLGAEHKPITIGRLQRYSMDFVYGGDVQVFGPVRATGKKVAVVGAGAAGLACAGELARRGHAVVLFEKRELAGGLSTYGIIGLREPVAVAQAEIEMIRRLGVEIRNGVELCRDVALADLQAQFDAVFISVGLGGAPALGIPGEEHIVDGLEYIEQSKMDAGMLRVGRRAAVIGAGNTAIDCATVAKRLGAEEVTIVYRRSESEVSAYRHEMEFVRKEGVDFCFLAQPVKVHAPEDRVTALECLRMSLGAVDTSGRPAPVAVAGSEFVLAVDQVIKAIGQQKPPLAQALGLKTQRGYIDVNAEFETSARNVFAGGDCIRASGVCSTVMAVQDGKLAARAIEKRLGS
ncbi:MAG: NAD(P)-dependent oxidoreductase [Acidobacteriaceae bacterium]|nr:NAD(P)-dependent oxidoreductase [Acidobacteriaceae bacterium]